MAILQDISKNAKGETVEQEVARLRAENQAYRDKAAARVPTVTVRVNALGTLNKQGEPNKGNIGVYGLGRYPTTLYKKQWLKLLAVADDIRYAIDNAEDGELADKDD